MDAERSEEARAPDAPGRVEKLRELARSLWRRLPAPLRDAASARLRHTERPPLIAVLSLLFCVSGVWGFIEIADEVRERETQAIDGWLLQLVRDPADPAGLRGPPWLAEVTRDITALGSTAVMALFTAIGVGYLWLRGLRASALLCASAVLGGVAIYSLLKLGYDRARPSEVPALVEVATRSFPSGHSMVSALVYLSLAMVLARLQTSLLLRGYIVAVGVTLAFLVGASRVLLGVHYPSDVLAGWAVGLAWAAACWLLVVWLERPRRTRRAGRPAGDAPDELSPAEAPPDR